MEINIENNKKSGIYYIMNLVNKKVYIGSSMNVYQRLHRHKSDLKKDRHANKHLQNSFNKHLGKFKAGLLMECKPCDLLFFEQCTIDLLLPDYNLMKDVVRHVLSEESKIKISETLKNKYKNGEIETYRQNHAWRKVHVYSLEGDYINSYPNVIYAATDLSLDAEGIRQSIRRKGRSGLYQFRYEKVKSLPRRKYNNKGKTIVYEKEGNKIIADSIKELADILNVSVGSINKALKRKRYKGGSLYRLQDKIT